MQTNSQNLNPDNVIWENSDTSTTSQVQKQTPDPTKIVWEDAGDASNGINNGDVLEPKPLEFPTTQSKKVKKSDGNIFGKLLKESEDVAQGLVEGPASILSGIGSFMGGLPIAAGEVVKGTIAGDPLAGMAGATDELNKIMDSWTYKPKSSFGKTIGEVASSPFTLAHEGIVRSFKDKAWVDSLTESQKKALSEGRIKNPKALKESWQQNNPTAGEEEGKAAQFAFDSALMLIPELRSKLEKKFKESPSESIDATKDILITEEEKSNIAEVMKEVNPDLTSNQIDKVLEQVKKVSKEPSKTNVESNQHIVDKLTQEAFNRNGKRRDAYLNGAKAIAELDKDASEVNVRDLKGIGKKLEKVIKEEISNRTSTKQTEVSSLNSKDNLKVTSEVSLKDSENEFNTLNVKKSLGDELTSEESNKYSELLDEKANSKEDIEVNNSGTEIKSYSSLEDASKEWDLGSEVSKKKADNYIPDKPLGDIEFTIIKVGDKYYRASTKIHEVGSEILRQVPKVEDVEFDPIEVGPTDEELRQEAKLLRESIDPNTPLDQNVDPNSEARVQELMGLYKEWKDHYVEKMDKGIESPTDVKETLPIVNDSFKTFKSREEAEAYKLANGIDREVISDPISGEHYIEPDLREIDDYSNSLLENYGDEFEGETLSDESTDIGYLNGETTKSLIDIFNNERGSVDLTDLKVAVMKTEELLTTAKKLGLTIDELLDRLDISDTLKEQLKLAIARLPEDRKKLKELDPEIERILNPDPEKVIYQKIKKNKKGGGVRKFVPLTKEEVKTVHNARKSDWKKSPLGRFMEATETRLHAFERYGKGVKELLWNPWTKKATDAERELLTQKKEIDELTKPFSKKELEEVSIVAYALQKGGIEALKASGIDTIPKLSQEQIGLLKEMRARYDKLWTRINYVRARIGLTPIPKVENYFPFIRKQNALKRINANSSIVFTPVKKFASESEFRGIFFPFEKRRRGGKIPLELDIFDNYNKYLSYALKEIHTAPIAALAKELATRKVKGYGKLLNKNPGLAKLLLEWSDEILGIDPVTTAINSKHPFIAEAAKDHSKNLVKAMIFGNISTVLNQFTAINGAYSMTNLGSILTGIGKTIVDHPFRMKESKAYLKSNVLLVRRADILLSEFADSIKSKSASGAKKLAEQSTAMFMNVTDAMTARVAWESGYSYAKKKLGMGEKEAIQWADDLVTKTQALGIKGAISPIQTTTSFKWFTLLQTYTIANFNFIARDIIGIKNPDINKSTQVRRVFRYVIGAAILNSAFKLAGLNPPFPSPSTAYKESIERDESQQEALAKAMFEFLNVVPVVGNIKYGSNFLGPLGELTGQIPDALNQSVKLLDWKHMTDADKIHTGMLIGKVLGYYYGVPMTNQIRKSIRAAVNGGTPYEIILGIYVNESKKHKVKSLPNL